MCSWGCPSSSIYSARGGEATLEEGAALGGALGFPSLWWGAKEGGRKLLPLGGSFLLGAFPIWASLVQVLPPPCLGAPPEGGKP